MNTSNLKARLSLIRLAVFDVDGVFTDGRFYLSDDGIETKAFHTQDGCGIRLLLDAGFQVAVISGRKSAASERRMAELGIQHVYFACSDKVAAFDELTGNLKISKAEALFVGDDLPDLPLLSRVGVSVAVANAVPAIKKMADYVSNKPGGFGAVREVCDLLLGAQAKTDA